MDCRSWDRSGWKMALAPGLKGWPSTVWGGWLWVAWRPRVRARSAPFASLAMIQMTAVACVFRKFVEGAVVYAGRQSCCSESSKSRSGLTWTSEKSAKTKPKSCIGRGQSMATVLVRAAPAVLQNWNCCARGTSKTLWQWGNVGASLEIRQPTGPRKWCFLNITSFVTPEQERCEQTGQRRYNHPGWMISLFSSFFIILI